MGGRGADLRSDGAAGFLTTGTAGAVAHKPWLGANLPWLGAPPLHRTTSLSPPVRMSEVEELSARRLQYVAVRLANPSPTPISSAFIIMDWFWLVWVLTQCAGAPAGG